MKKPKTWEVFTALDKNGFYWDGQIGKCYYPDVFITHESARRQCELVKKRWDIQVEVVKMSLTPEGKKK